MPRYAVKIEYDGTPFVGWQFQENGPSVQAALQTALTSLSGEHVQVFGAGRTDAGVHALGQVAHFDLSREWPADTLRDGLNHHLRPQSVSIVSAAPASEEFHARFSAITRHYRYVIANRRAPLALERDRAWRVSGTLDGALMHQAAQVLCGKHDFTTFRSANCQATSPVRTLDAISIERAGERVEINVSARSFLHNQVRSIVGSLKLVGLGKWSAQDLAAALEAKDRRSCGPVAPAGGLYFLRVDYPSGDAEK